MNSNLWLIIENSIHSLHITVDAQVSREYLTVYVQGSMQ